jgi:hypothetical protein
MTSMRSDSVGFRVDLWCYTALLVELQESPAVPQRSRGGPRRSRERPGNVA